MNNPNANPKLLELKEFSYARTAASVRRDREGWEANIRDLMWMHRFDIYTFLISRGVAIPMAIAWQQITP